VRPLAEQLGSDFCFDCDVSRMDALDTAFDTLGAAGRRSTSWSTRSAFPTRPNCAASSSTPSLDNFLMTMNISAYSLVAVTNRARPMMPNGGSILTLTYYGAEKVVPHYNVMGVAKAALETSVKYLANDLGPGEHPRQRDQRRADQDARGERDRRLPLHPQVERDQRAAPAQRHDRGRRRAGLYMLSDLLEG
jgi:enoyl-[acyl-carrier-protein] reductase (NADH)